MQTLSQAAPGTFEAPGAVARRFADLCAPRLIMRTVGVIFGLSGANHGLFEFLQGNRHTDGLVIQAIGEAQRFWPLGTEEAFTLLPTYRLAGIASMVLGLVIVVWSLGGLDRRHGRTVFLALFVLLFLAGGGIGQLAFFLPAWAFGTRIGKPLTWWRKVLPRKRWPVFSRTWPVALVSATVLILAGLEIAIFGVVPGMRDPVRIQNTAMSLVLASALLYVLASAAGFGHELLRLEHKMVSEGGGV